MRLKNNCGLALTKYIRSIFIMLLFTLCMVAMPSEAGPESEASTVDFTNSALTGKPDGITMMNAPCIYDNKFYYLLKPEGEIWLEGAVTCGRFVSVDGRLICTLGVDMRCTARPDFFVKGSFAASERGISVPDGTTYVWRNQATAVAMFSGITAKAETRCENVLSKQAHYAKHGKTPPETTLQAEADCKPLLDKLCSSAASGATPQAKGRDISILCP